MFCQKCGSEIDEKVKSCPKCGARIKGISISISKKCIRIIVGICAIGIIGVGVWTIIQNPVHNVMKLIESNDVEAANKVYIEKIEESTSKKEKLEKKLVEEVKKVQEEFVNNNATYDESKEKLNGIEKLDIEVPNLTEVKNTISRLNNSRKAYRKAQEAIETECYEQAIEELRNVIETDENYEQAQKEVKQVAKKYEEYTLKEVETQIAAKKYEEADTTIQKALDVLEDNEALKEKAATIEEKVKKARLERRKQEKEEARKAQRISVISADVIEQSANLKTLYPDMIQVVFKNNFDQAVKNIVVSCIGFDKNGLPVKIKPQFSFRDADYEFLGNAEAVNILPGESFGSESGWTLDESHGITYVLACVKEATFYDEKTWCNPYYSYWKQEYLGKELPEDLR